MTVTSDSLPYGNPPIDWLPYPAVVRGPCLHLPSVTCPNCAPLPYLPSVPVLDRDDLIAMYREALGLPAQRFVTGTTSQPALPPAPPVLPDYVPADPA